MNVKKITPVKRALLSVSDKTGIIELATALQKKGVEIFSSGGTLKTLSEAGIKAIPVEKLSKSPEAFQGRMKTLSFPIFGGILARRGDESDSQDLRKLEIQEIDLVVVNFYPFEQAAPNASKEERIELIDIGGPALVRAAAKNSKDVLVLTEPSQYAHVITELESNKGFTPETSEKMAALAWKRIFEYDSAIYAAFGPKETEISLRYGENPHQRASLTLGQDSPIEWNRPLTSNALSYNNILDLSSAYSLAAELKTTFPEHASCVIVKHNNPCGIASISTPATSSVTEKAKDSSARSLEMAWSGDPISAFGGVIVLTEPLNEKHVRFLSGKFIELLAAPELDPNSEVFQEFSLKRKGLKAVRILRFELPTQKTPRHEVSIPGGILIQDWDTGLRETLSVKTGRELTAERESLARFGIHACRALKSNAIAIVHALSNDSFFLAGAGQGQPNRIDALKLLAVPRAVETLKGYGETIKDSILISDAFFPFRDSIDATADAGIRTVLQPGGSLRDAEVIDAAKEREITLIFTGVRHFKH
jgi:phosphoribosylaminoimidazolecarboxamide formyltransferase / IMP cyclohydrolase